MTMQHQIDAAIAKAIDRARFTYFDQLIVIHQGQVCVVEEDDLSFRSVGASDTVLHKIAGELSDDDQQIDWFEDETICLSRASPKGH